MGGLTLSLLHKDRVAIVTGASAGLGLALTAELVEEGAKVTMVARNAERLKHAAESIEADFPDAKLLPIPADITSESDTEKYIRETHNHFGTVDYLVNNAAYDGENTHLINYDMEDFRMVLDTNITAVANAIRLAAPIMVKQGKGSIVSVGSNSGLAGVENLSAYSASKHGLIGLTKTAAIELGPKGVRVNATAPGGIKTEMLEEYLDNVGAQKGISGEEFEALMTSNNPLRRFSTPEEQSYVISFLLSDKASYITGETITVDGGQSSLLSS